MSFSNILRGIGGDFEIGRVWVSGASGVAIASPIVFQAWDMARGAHFDVAAWCVAYPGGLAALVTAGILGIGRKDQNVEAARTSKAVREAEQ
jgi:hypothetical protein